MSHGAWNLALGGPSAIASPVVRPALRSSGPTSSVSPFGCLPPSLPCLGERAPSVAIVGRCCRHGDRCQAPPLRPRKASRAPSPWQRAGRRGSAQGKEGGISGREATPPPSLGPKRRPSLRPVTPRAPCRWSSTASPPGALWTTASRGSSCGHPQAPPGPRPFRRGFVQEGFRGPRDPRRPPL